MARTFMMNGGKLTEFFGGPYLRGEGAPIHPDDCDADLTEDQYEKQLRAYREHWNMKEIKES